MYNQWLNPKEIDKSFPKLKTLSLKELEDLQENEEEIKKMVSDSDIIKSKQNEKENLLVTIKSLSEYNLSKELPLNQLKIHLSQTHQEAVEAFKRYQNHSLQIESSPSKTSCEVQLALLQTETAKSEELCEELVSKLYEKEINIEDFIKDFIDKKKITIIRKLKSDKMKEILRNQLNRPVANDNRYPGNHPYPPYPSSNQPYPNNQPYPPSNQSYFPNSQPYHSSNPPYPSDNYGNNSDSSKVLPPRLPFPSYFKSGFNNNNNLFSGQAHNNSNLF